MTPFLINRLTPFYKVMMSYIVNNVQRLIRNCGTFWVFQVDKDFCITCIDASVTQLCCVSSDARQIDIQHNLLSNWCFTNFITCNQGSVSLVAHHNPSRTLQGTTLQLVNQINETVILQHFLSRYTVNGTYAACWVFSRRPLAWQPRKIYLPAHSLLLCKARNPFLAYE